MKAICGFLHLEGQAAPPAALDALRQALVYNPATFTESSGRLRSDARIQDALALGAARWSQQPDTLAEPQTGMHAATGCIATVDARIANASELRAALSLGNTTAGTPELLLHAWLRWGEDCVDHLEGDFAFALFDPREQVLFCARDRMGVRPLYLHHVPGKFFAFASRARALLALPQVPRDLNPGRIADALVTPLEIIDKTSTFHAAIQRLPPAHTCRITPDALSLRNYWKPRPGRVAPLPRDDAGWADALTEVLERAVAAHLGEGNTVGCMLSGGMDSSSLAAIARDQRVRAGRAPIATFSSIDCVEGCAETIAIRAVLTQPGFAPTLIDPDQVDAIAAELHAALFACEEPFDIWMSLVHAQYLMAARTGMTAVMDGIDADVLLTSGSALIRQIRHGHWVSAWRNARGQQRHYPDLPAWRTLAGATRSALTPDWARPPLRRLRRRLRQRDSLDHSWIAPEFAAAVRLEDRLATFGHWSPPVLEHTAPEEAAVGLLHPCTIGGFERYHRVASWYGVDPRHPFNDREVMELCVNLPDHQRFRNGHTKFVLRNAMRGRLPESVCWRTGKEHLGSDVTLRVLAHGVDPNQALGDRRDLLAPYIARGKLERAIAIPWAQANADTQGDILQALALALWLERHHNTQPTATG